MKTVAVNGGIRRGTPANSSLVEGQLAQDVMKDGAASQLLLGAVVAGLFFVGFLGWAVLTPLDAAAYGQGTIAVEGHRQTIQHKDGGIITALNVQEGSHVTAGQVLISLAPAEVEAAERSMAAQVIGLEAQHARLQAEQNGSSAIKPPEDFALLTGQSRVEAEQAMELQRREMRARASSLSSQEAVLHQRAAQIQRAIEGYDNQISTTMTQSGLINDELKGTKSLAAHGYASQNRVRALERDDAGLAGQRADLAANAARSQAQIGETQMQALSLKNDKAENTAKDLRDAEFQLDDLLPKLKALKEQLAQTEIRAPVAGQVVGLTVFTVGGVVTPGAKLMDIVPDNAPLVIEAQLPPNNADQIYAGQKTEVRITSMNDRHLPILTGTISRISADSFVDEKSGAHYFTIEVTIPDDEAAEIRNIRGPRAGLRAGLPVQVVIPLRKRTAFQFLLEPLSQAIWKSGHE
jgi:HlyD family secretion protein